MSNLLLYVEENLVFLPEQCYESETSVPGSSNKMSGEKSTNVPLILPQSILQDKQFKTSSEFTVSEKSQNSLHIAEENVQYQVSQNNSVPNTFTCNRNNTNPFLQDQPVYNGPDLSPLKFIQLWSENIKLQMQITAILSVLYDKVMKDTTKKENENVIKDENINMMNNTFLYAKNNIPVSSANYMHFNTSNTCQDTSCSIANNSCNDAKDGIMNYYFRTIGCPMQHSIFTPMNDQQLLPTTSSNENLNLNIYANSFQNADIQNNSSIYSNNLVPINNSFGLTNQSLMNRQVITNINVPPECEHCNNKFKLDLENYFANNVSTDLTPAEKCISNDIPLKETNPFKLSLANKLQISNQEEENCLNSVDLSSDFHENRTSNFDCDSILNNFEMDNSKIQSPNHEISENSGKDTSSNHSEYCFANSSSSKSIIKNESFALNAKPSPSEYNWNVDNVTNTMSKIIINNQPPEYNIHKAEEMEKHIEKNFNSFVETNMQEYVKKEKQEENLDLQSCFLSAKKVSTDYDGQSADAINKEKQICQTDVFNLNQSQSSPTHDSDFSAAENISNCKIVNEKLTSKCGLNKRTSFTQTTNLGSSLLVDNINYNEGHFAYPSTLHTSYALSPSVQASNETEYNQQLLNKNLNKSREVWIENFTQVKDYNKMYTLSQKNEEEAICHKNQPHNNIKHLTVEDTIESQINVDNTDVKMSCSKEDELKNNIAKCVPTNHTVFFQAIELPKRIMHIFYHRGEGWLLTNEFVESFTKLETAMFAMNLFDACNIRVHFEEIDRKNSSVKFINIGNTSSKVTQDIESGVNNIQLIELKCAIKLLNWLGILSHKDINNIFMNEKFSNDSIIQGVWLIVNAYRELKHHIEIAK